MLRLFPLVQFYNFDDVEVTEAFGLYSEWADKTWHRVDSEVYSVGGSDV